MGDDPISGQCPLPDRGSGDNISLAHGEGGKLMRDLISRHILSRLGSSRLDVRGDAAVLELPGAIAVSTDSYVVSPLFFPGGDIGKLCVYGTANDLAVSGARPRWLTLSLIIEEGLSTELFDRVIASITEAAEEAEIEIVSGDTKVVPCGAVDGLFINTTGIGVFERRAPPGPAAVEEGDELIVSGPIGQHGMAILASRGDLGFATPIKSDCGALFPAAERLHSHGVHVRAMRDATRGGVSAVLQEWAEASAKTMIVEESMLPISDLVRGACELLGLDPLHIACEGTMVIAVPAGEGKAAVEALRSLPVTSQAACIGHVDRRRVSAVAVRRMFGRLQPLDDPLGAPLPRIC